MTATFELSDEDQVCCNCDRPLPPGAPIGESLIGMAGDSQVVETVCVYCAMALHP